MATPASSVIRPGLVKFALLAAAAALLYFAREICIPFALAILLAFLLAPVVAKIQKWLALWRTPAVLIVMAGVLAVILLAGWLVLSQFVQLAEQLPQYRTTVHEKLSSLHTKPGGTFDQINRTFNDYAQEISSLGSQAPQTQPAPASPSSAPSTPSADTTAATAPDAIPVRVTNPKVSGLDLLRTATLDAIGPLIMLGIVLILTLFILIQWQDVRDRVLRLIGQGQLQTTTQTFDDAGSRVSRYLLLQMAVNIVYGGCVFGGLMLIGVPNSPLWGLLAATLRFLPYFGIPVAAIPPVILAFVTGHGFGEVLMTLGLYAVLELVTAYFVEPWLYGSRTGISPLAILASALFWAWIWGPMGLLLSTPLTVCLAVIGRHVPALRFLHVIFGDEPALPPEKRFYQRLLAGDQDEASDIAEEFLRQHSQLQLFDDFLLPALLDAEHDRRRGNLDDAARHAVYGCISSLLEDLEDRDAAAPPAAGPSVLCIPASTQADELASRMLAAHLRQRGARISALPVEALAGEGVQRARELHPDVICISALPPQALPHARYLAKRLRTAHPPAKIVVGLWHVIDARALEDRLPPSLVEAVATTISAAANEVAVPRSPDTHEALAHAAPA